MSDPYDDTPEGAQLIERPDGSVVVQPVTKRVKTGTWVFYPNKKSRGRSFKTYDKPKRMAGEPDQEFNPQRGGGLIPTEQSEGGGFFDRAFGGGGGGGQGGGLFDQAFGASGPQMPQRPPRLPPMGADDMMGMAGIQSPSNDMMQDMDSFLMGGPRRRPQF